MTQAVGATSGARGAQRNPRRSIMSLVGLLEIDTRMIGMVFALLIIWIGFNFASDGKFITARNLWNLSVQSTSVAVMATGMVLIIVSRNIDLSVGSVLGFTGYSMAMLQAIWIPQVFGLGLNQPYTWVVTVIFGLLVGAFVGLVQGLLVAYGQIPSFIVTLGGLLIWRGLIFRYYQGQTIAPLDSTFDLLGGGPAGSLGGPLSWVVGAVVCVAVVWILFSGRRRRMSHGFPVRPMWAELVVGALAVGVVVGAIGLIFNAYPWPPALATQYAQAHGITEPPGGLIIQTGIPFPVLILGGVAVVMTVIGTRRKFGRYVYAIGGNPEAAELGGINVRRTITGTFVLMGILCAVSGVISTARLTSAVTGLGTQNELDVISAAVIGGTSFAGGIGTIPGAILGAVVMQSLRSGMATLNVDSPMQDVIVGCVLVAAVGFDSWARRRSS